MGRWYIPFHRKVMWLVLTNRQLAGSDMWHSKPKHIVAVETDSSSEREGHICQMVCLWDTGDNIYLGPWMAMCMRTLQPHQAHCVRKKSQWALCQIASSPFTPPFYTQNSHFHSRNFFFFLLFCFYYLPIIPLLVLATEKDWANVLRDQTVMTPRAFIWVLTESAMSIFPVLRKKNRKWKSLELILSLLLIEMPSLNYDSGLCRFRGLTQELSIRKAFPCLL